MRTRLLILLWVGSFLVSGGGARDRSDALRNSAWLERAQHHLAEREYHATDIGHGLQAPNRAHNVRTYFESTRIRVHDRTASGNPELLQLSLAAVGRGGSLAAVAPGTPIAQEGRVEIRRPGIVEWYVNSAAGLEQGFTLEQRPEGQGPLALDLAVAGARAALHGDAIVFDAGRRRLRYGELVATDAAGEMLLTHFELPRADALRIVVDDAGATYPIAIDPLLTEAADTQLEANQATARLGDGVAAAGDVNGDGYGDVIVGARLYDAGLPDEGAAFVLLGSASGVADANPATPGVTLLESNQQASGFGWSVAGAGDVNGDGYDDVIVGANSYDAGLGAAGAAFVFLGSASGIANANPATPGVAQLDSDQAGAQFGQSVAGAGDVNGDGYADVIAGAHFYNAGQPAEGAAFVFLGSASGIADTTSASAAAQLESDQANALLGISVSGAGDVNGDGYSDVIVGSENYGAGQSGEGAAFVFLGSASGIADGNPVSADTQLESNQATALLGSSVAAAGDVNGDGYGDLIVGARLYDAGTTDEGAAFVFLGSATGIADGSPVTAAAQLESNQGLSSFGFGVSGAGDTNGDGYADVLVGADQYDAGQTDEGAAFLFLGSATGVADGNPTSAAAQLESDQASARGGYRVAGAGDVNGDGYADVIVSAYFYDAGTSDEGAVFIYHGGGSGIADGNPATAGAELEPDQASANLGHSVAGAGDVNGDGYADVIVGAPFYDAGQTDEGAAFVFLGSASGIADGDPATAPTQLESNQASAQFGYAVGGAGDVNGDGYADVIVGARYYHAPETDEGAVFVFLGSASGIADGSPATAAAQLESDQPGAQLGVSVAGAGDVNGDGYGDVIVSASYYDSPQLEEGAAFVFLGSASGVADGNPATAAAQLESDQTDALLGSSVAGAGDVNGDGYADVIVGAYQYDAGQTDEGAVWVFLGSASGVADGNPATAAAQLESDQVNGQLGHSVASAGDVNGDGYADVIVSSYFYDAGETDEGEVYVFLGSATGIAGGNPATAATRLQSNQPDARLGKSVAGAGDVNGDGYADVIAGAYFYDAGPGLVHGEAYVFLGSASGIADGDPSTAAARIDSNQEDAQLGKSVAGAGDVNGDGYADVLVGVPYYDSGELNEGAAFVFLGNSGAAGRPVLARQRRGDGSGVAVEPWGSSESATGFAAEIRAHHPNGAGRVRAEIEACPAGVAFDDASCTTALTPGWVAVNGATPEVVLSDPFMGLTNNRLYRWRARVLHAPSTGTIPGEPAHGPWRRYRAQAVEADIRVLPEPGLLIGLASAAAFAAVLTRRGKRPIQ
jgi:FG-GAP repeat protein